MTKRIFVSLMAMTVSFVGFCATDVLADAISPNVKDKGAIYSEAMPDESVFGNGAGAELAEASTLRFQGERKLKERKYDEAITILSKAVQFDQGDPQSHILLARAMTAKIMHAKDLPDSKHLKDAIDEWKMIWHHDADQTEQAEAKGQAKLLSRLAKSIEKDQIHTMSGTAELLSGSREERELGFGM